MSEKTSTTEWKAWIDIQPVKKTPGGTLHVNGAILAGPEKINYQLSKAVLQGIIKEELILVVEPDPTKGKNEIPLHYTEDLLTQNQYTTVRVRIGGHEDVVIDHIDIVQ
jgi:hypothetical protein